MQYGAKELAQTALRAASSGAAGSPSAIRIVLLVIAVLAGLLTGGLSGAYASVLATEARLGVHPDKTRFVLDLSEETGFSVSTSAAPWRVTVDLPQVGFAPKQWPEARGLVGAVRRDATSSGVRLALETTGPVRVAWATVIPPRDGRPPRFILDLEPVDAQAFTVQRLDSGIVHAALPLPPASSSPSVSTPAPAVGERAAPLAPAAASLGLRLVPASISRMGVAVPVPRAKPPQREKPLIVIDPGHGGRDPGAVAVNGMYEKEITLATALELQRQLLAGGRYRVALTRDRDIAIPLRDRVSRARSLGADLFISLHADSIGRKEVRGLSVYTLSDKASDREAEMLAQRENRADAIIGMDLSAEADEVVSVLIDLAQRDTRNQSLRFASLVVREVGREMTLLPQPQRSAGFAVLTAPDVPSVLVEMGYLSHPADAKLLASAAHRQRLARSLHRAIDAYFGQSLLASRS